MTGRRTLLIIAAASACLLALGGCLALQPHQMDNTQIDAYAEASKKKNSSKPAARALGIERWQALLSDFSEGNLKGKVSAVYADETFFNDTLKTLCSAGAIEEYLLETASMLEHGSVSYDDVVESGEDVYVRWRMVYRSKKIAKGQDIVTIGMSHLRFDSDGKVVLHQDFWDSTRGLFEHVPLIGTGIRTIKKRL
jgi:hypothetical protein